MPHDPCPKVLQLFGVIRAQPDGLGRKDQLLEIRPMAAVRLTNHKQGIERPLRRTILINTRPHRTRLWSAFSASQAPRMEPEQIFFFTMSYRTGGALSGPQTFFLLSNLHQPTQPHLFRRPPGRRRSIGAFAEDQAKGRPIRERKEWWSRTGSNRRHPACKAGALPAELRPQFV